jgi:hypothetical protein
MRTTLDIADDVLAAIKERARVENRTAGDVLSALARLALTGKLAAVSGVREERAPYGFRPFPDEGKVVSNDLINDIREREGI